MARTSAEEIAFSKVNQVRSSFPEGQHGVNVPQQVPHLIHQHLHLLVFLAHLLGINQRHKSVKKKLVS